MKRILKAHHRDALEVNMRSSKFAVLARVSNDDLTRLVSS